MRENITKNFVAVLLITICIYGCNKYPINRAEFEVLKCSDGSLTLLPRYNPFNFYSNKRLLAMNLLEKIDKTVLEDSTAYLSATSRESLSAVFEANTAATYEYAAVTFMDYKNMPCDNQRQKVFLDILKELMGKQYELDTYQRQVYSIYRNGRLNLEKYESIRIVTNSFLTEFEPYQEGMSEISNPQDG